MLWDGTEISLNDFTIRKAIYEKYTYWVLIKDKIKDYCIMRYSTHTLSCLIDELKPIFKIEKNGTHWAKHIGKIVILTRVNVINNVIIEDLSLSEIKYRESIVFDIQKIFLFREILGITRSWEKNIMLRKQGLDVIILSFYEPNMSPGNRDKVIPDTVLDKWFPDTNLDEVIKKIFGISKSSEVTNLIHELRIQMLQIFNRVGKNAINNIDEILFRIGSRLQFILK